MPFLFLDLDGVVNTHDFCPECKHGPVHRDKMNLVNRVLRETGASVVISSAWRYLVHNGDMTLIGFERMMRSHGMIADRVVGVTPPDTMVREQYNGVPSSWPLENERGTQIAEWLAARALISSDPTPPRYAVVDDLDLGISAKGHPLFPPKDTRSCKPNRRSG